MMSSSKKIRHGIVITIAACLWAVALGITVFMLFSYLLPQDLTQTTEPYATLVLLSFYGRVFTFHASILLALIVAMSILLRRRRLVCMAALMSLALAGPTLISLRPHDPPESSGPNLRLMSMNLKYIRGDADRIINQINKYSPDVIVLEDYTPFVKSALDKQFANDYPHRYLLPNSLQGLAMFSRLPFDTRPKTAFTKTRRQMRAIVVFHGQPIVIYVEHPFSPRTRQRIINNRLATVDLAKQVQGETLPVIAAGDFNFTSETPNEAALKGVGLKDGFELAGHGRGSTWPVDPPWMQWLPGVRIDHIFVSPQLTCMNFFVGEYDGSDHLPIIADIAFLSAK